VLNTVEVVGEWFIAGVWHFEEDGGDDIFFGGVIDWEEWSKLAY